MDAFISHSSKDDPTARRVEQVLEAHGLRAWLDRSDIQLGVLLRPELRTAIEDAGLVVLLWSRNASKSRWIAAEILTAYHLDRFIVPCALDATALPYFLQNAIRLEIRPGRDEWTDPLCRAVASPRRSRNDVPEVLSSQSPELQHAIGEIAAAQARVLDRLGERDLPGAKALHAPVAAAMAAAEKAWPLERMVLDLAGYQHKNAYMLKHWDAVQAGRPPDDPLLERAERHFFEALFVEPNDVSALNGLGSILMFQRDLDAAEFFIRRAIALSEQQGLDYADAHHDLAMIQAPRAQPGQSRG